MDREFASDIFEAQALYLLGYRRIPDFEPKEKTAITSFDMLAYLRALAQELCFFTFGKEKSSKNICKLHRYLKLNLASYLQKCVVEVKKPDEITDPAAAPLLPKGKISFLD